jgi:hypothetical protein
MDFPLVAIVGTIEIVGPVVLGPDDTTYPYLIIRDHRGEPRGFNETCARPGVSNLVEPHTTGLFVFRHTREETRLWCVVCEDGRLAVDFTALRSLA